MTSELQHIDTWRGHHLDYNFKIVLHDKGKTYAAGGQGTWCYYIYIPESKIGTEAFAPLWLEPKVVKFTPESEGYVSYDYFDTPVSNLEWHGGVTYYDKHGEIVGKRVVEFGCDYNHLYDDQIHWDLYTILGDVYRTIQQIHDLYDPSLT